MENNKVTIEINGENFSFPPGTNILQACNESGFPVPHFCYHPCLPVSGNCRMCMVELEVNERSKVDVACVNTVAEGLKVRTDTPAVLKARRASLEFLLLNHPLDCPYCDCAGECKLQDYYEEYGNPEYSRYIEEKNHKTKRQSIGRNLRLDAERCVLCTRCVRFFEEVVGKKELGVRNRGARSEIHALAETGVDNDYTGNVVDTCPVGALTDNSFRFQRRTWYLQSVPTICPDCARGCNIELQFDLEHDYKQEGKRVQRIKPRYNESVNRAWICDSGRYGFAGIDENRLQQAFLNREGVIEQIGSVEAINEAARLINSFLEKNDNNSLAVLASPDETNEGLLALKQLFREGLQLSNIDYRLAGEPTGEDDQLLKRADLHPNSRGCADLKLEPKFPAGSLAEQIESGAVTGLIALRHNLPSLLNTTLLEKLKLLIVLETHSVEWSRQPDLLLPLAVYAEQSGSFTNCDGITQQINSAFTPLGEARPTLELMHKLAEKLKVKGVPANLEQARKLMSSISADFATITGPVAGPSREVSKAASIRGKEHV
jgi:NADH-quinone oxidoreductase subunit G